MGFATVTVSSRSVCGRGPVMKIMKSAIAATMLLGAVVSAPAWAATTVINFDNGSENALVGATYAALGVTFGGATFTSNFGLAGSSGALGINSTTQGFLFGSDNAITGSFTGSIANVTIRGIDVGQAGIRLEAYSANNILIGFDQFFGPDVGVGTFHDLSVSGSNIANFRVFQALSSGGGNAFGDGVLFDNLSFTTAAVPEPATWGMMILGFGMIGAASRSRKVKTSVKFA